MIGSIRSIGVGVFAALVATLAIGCGGERLPAPAPANDAPPRPAAPAPEASTAPKPSINISNDILATCKIEVADPAKAPKFDLDSQAVLPEERAVLAKLATCLTSGPLKGHKVQLVGRADPRGEVNYNMALAAGRAKSVSTYLTQLGVEATRMKETSRGELDASGTDEESWRKDRRVDISLAD